MPRRRDLLERLTPDNPHYGIGRKFYLEAWADSHFLVAEALAGRASFSDFVDGCALTFSQGAQAHVAIKDETPIPAKCRAVDDLARKFIRQFTDSVALESKWLGEAQVTAAIDALSRRVNEIASRSKQQILEAALTEQSGESPGPPQQQSHTVSGGWPMGKLERTFSASQQERLKNADERLRIALEAHEKMREIVDPGGWHPVAPQINAQTLVDEIRKLEDDLRKIAIDIFNVLAEAAWPLGSLEPFRTQLEVDAREILEWVLAKVNPKDLPSLDKTSLENAISRQVSNWIRKARQTFAPPWAAYTEAKAEPSLAEQQRYSSRDQIQSAVRDLFKEDTSARPLGDNPFPSDHPAHQAFEESTWEAKEAIGKLQSRLLVAYNTPAELLQSIFKFRTGYFNVVVKQAMCIVGDAESARWYESWVNDFARFYLDDTVSRIKCRDPNAAPQAPPYFDPESVAGFERDLTFELMRIVGHYKTEATSIVLRIKKEKSNASAKGPKRRGRRPNEDRRDAIRSAITKYGDEWRDHLGDIFNELDGKEVPLGDLQARKIDLGDGESTKVSKWDDLDLAQGEQRRQIIDVLRKYAH